MKRMAEARQICCALDQLHADELAAERQDHLVRVRPMIDRQMVDGLGRVGFRLESARMRADRKEELRAEGMGRA